MFAPIYVDNLKLQTYVEEITRRVDMQNQPDEALRQNVLNKARELDLPVKADNVHIIRSPEGLRIDVRYFVRVTLPGLVSGMGFPGHNELHRALRIGQEAKQSLRVLQQQVWSFVGCETARKAQRQSIEVKQMLRTGNCLGRRP